MSDQVIRTLVFSSEGTLEFQEYFVHKKCLPAVTGFKFEGVEQSEPAPGVLDAIRQAEYEKIAEELEKNREFLLQKVPSEWDDDYEEFLRSFKTALFLNSWINESGEDYTYSA
jgi:hypothetical protein